MPRLIPWLLAAVFAAAASPAASAATVRVAVASNFHGSAKAIAEQYRQRSGDRVILSFGSTGTLYAQIRNGAPFDAFFAADVERPRRLESEGVAVPGSRFTYAVGRLVLWSAKPGVVDPKGDVLRNGDFRKLAIANPTLAPYGAAARQLLLAMDLWDRLQGRLVVGQNIGQTHQFVASGNAELGLVALSQVEAPGRPLKGSHWIVPRRLYEPIQQQAVRLDESRAARRFMEFVRGPEAARIIESYGYGVPE